MASIGVTSLIENARAGIRSSDINISILTVHALAERFQEGFDLSKFNAIQPPRLGESVVGKLLMSFLFDTFRIVYQIRKLQFKWAWNPTSRLCVQVI